MSCADLRTDKKVGLLIRTKRHVYRATPPLPHVDSALIALAWGDCWFGRCLALSGGCASLSPEAGKMRIVIRGASDLS